LPPDERRLAILKAVLPVVRTRGTDVTTRELAEAAGVAEGTLFRVFDDKESLVREAIAAALDPGEFIEQLGAIDLALPVEERLGLVIRTGVARMADLALWMTMLHGLRRPGDGHGGLGKHEGWAQRQQASQMLVRAQLRRILEPDADRLRHPIDAVIAMLEASLTGAIMQAADRLRQGEGARAPDPDLIVDFFLHGALRSAEDTH
jgi:AcrR family transcriptional regulator